ncbi:MerR family transcriptional regulator [Micromonospora sp. M12]
MPCSVTECCRRYRDHRRGDDDDRGPAGYSVEELARKVGMSPRNIRAHQAGGCCPAGAAWPGGALRRLHVRRLDAILALQRQGFNLVSIEAMLGVRASDEAPDGLTAMLQRLTADRPALAHALTRHGVIGRTTDGTVRTVRPRPLRRPGPASGTRGHGTGTADPQ